MFLNEEAVPGKDKQLSERGFGFSFHALERGHFRFEINCEKQPTDMPSH